MGRRTWRAGAEGLGEGRTALRCGQAAGKVLPALKAARQKGVLVVRASRVGQGILARNGEADDDALDFVVADTLSAQKARILLMLALTKTGSSTDIQRMFYTY